MSANQKVSEYLDHYLASDDRAEFAVMLSGPWGCGKTAFIKQYFEEVEAVSRTNDPLAGPAYLYASLYGVRSVSEITDQFFAQLHPVLSSKAVRIVGTLLSRGVNGYAGTEFNSPGENSNLLKTMALKLEERVLVFDDLERCKMGIPEAMGFINSYVEHEGLKVIIVANEDEIPDRQGPYAIQKEKLVGKTLGIASDTEVVLDTILAKISSEAAKNAILANNQILITTFDQGGKQNLRTLKYVLSDYERLVEAAHHRLRASKEAMGQLLTLMVALGIEYHSGATPPEELSSLSGTTRTHKNQASSALSAALVARLSNTYGEVRWSDMIAPSEALIKLFQNGIIDIDVIDQHIATHPLVVGYDEIPAWRQLWNWYDLPRARYLKARATLISELESYSLKHPGIIVHAAGIILQLKANGDELLGDGNNVVDYFEKYVAELNRKGELEPVVPFFGAYDNGHAGLGYQGMEQSDFEAVYTHISAASTTSFASRIKSDTANYIDRLRENPSEYVSLITDGFEHGNYARIPFLHYLSTDDFANLLIEDGVVNSRLLSYLVLRFEGDKASGLLVHEHDWITELHSRLEQVTTSIVAPQQNLTRSRIDLSFKRIEDAIEPWTPALTLTVQR